MTVAPTFRPTQTAPFLDSSELLGQPQALRDRASKHGYLFFRNLLPEDAVLHLRRQFLQIVQRYGWLADGHDLMEGVADLEAFNREDPDEALFCGVGVSQAAYRDVQRLPEFHELAHYPRLLALYRDLFAGPVFPHPMSIARLMISGDAAKPTPPHQDFIFIQGTTNVWTAWIPLGDTPRDMGPLTVLDRSHEDGILSYERVEGAGGHGAYLCDAEMNWAEGDFAAGDVLTFHSHTVHRALPNQHPERIRLSCDFRYQPLHEEIIESSLKVHCDVMSWDEVYEGWPEGGVQWYWREHALRMGERDPEIADGRDKIC